MKRTLMMTVALIFAGHTAFAAITAETIAADLTEQGYTRIEIRQGPTQTKVEAIRGTETLEVVYDTETGDVLKSETGVVYQGENTTPGIEVSVRDRDFVDGADSDEDGDDHHDGATGSDDDGHDDGDDNGDDDENDDENDDDQGGDDGDGDHDGGDHDGGDHDGGDSEGDD